MGGRTQWPHVIPSWDSLCAHLQAIWNVAVLMRGSELYKGFTLPSQTLHSQGCPSQAMGLCNVRQFPRNRFSGLFNGQYIFLPLGNGSHPIRTTFPHQQTFGKRSYIKSNASSATKDDSVVPRESCVLQDGQSGRYHPHYALGFIRVEDPPTSNRDFFPSSRSLSPALLSLVQTKQSLYLSGYLIKGNHIVCGMLTDTVGVWFPSGEVWIYHRRTCLIIWTTMYYPFSSLWMDGLLQRTSAC